MVLRQQTTYRKKNQVIESKIFCKKNHEVYDTPVRKDTKEQNCVKKDTGCRAVKIGVMENNLAKSTFSKQLEYKDFCARNLRETKKHYGLNIAMKKTANQVRQNFFFYITDILSISFSIFLKIYLNFMKSSV